MSIGFSSFFYFFDSVSGNFFIDIGVSAECIHILMFVKMPNNRKYYWDCFNNTSVKTVRSFFLSYFSFLHLDKKIIN